MNRIKLGSQTFKSHPQPDQESGRPHNVEQALFSLDQKPGSQVAIFAPLHYERKYAYPLLVWLHGTGHDERQLQRIMPLISMRNYVAVGPRGPSRCESSSGYEWPQSGPAISAAEHRVFDAIEQVQEKYNIAEKRVFLAGFQSGGTMAFRIALQHPGHFAGALSVGGAFPSGNQPLRRINDARQLPLFIANGRENKAYDVTTACDELRLFHSAGLSVSVRQYPCGDELHTQMLHDMDVWVMEHVTGCTKEPGIWNPE